MRRVPLIAWMVLAVWALAPGASRAVGVAGAAPPGPAATAPAPRLGPTPLPDQDPVASRLWAAWSAPASGLSQRVSRVRQAGLALGMTSLEAPARALLLDTRAGSPLARARAAARLAPDLPAARAALARALFAKGDVRGGVSELLAALRAVPEQLDARLWADATGLRILLGAALGGCLLFLAVAGACNVPRLIRDLGMLHDGLSASSRLALVAAFLLVPAACGEGLLGIGLAFAALALAYGSLAQRICVGLALVGCIAALHPLLEIAARAEMAGAADPVAVAAWTAENEIPDAVDLARLRRDASSSFLASRALALRDKREGRLAEAERRYRGLLAVDDSPDLLNNSAGVLLARGETSGAIDLYKKAVRGAPTATSFFNLSQAYGRAIRLDDQDQALSQAQALDPERVHELASTPGNGAADRVVDIPLAASAVAAQLDAPRAAHELAAQLRRRISPGLAGSGLPASGGAVLASAVIGLALGALLGRLGGEDDIYSGIARLLQGAEGADSAKRARDLAELRARQARMERAAGVVSLVVPGAAGILDRRPVLALIAVLVFALGASVFAFRNGVVPDPLALGILPHLLLAPLLGLLGLVYVAATALVLALGRRS